MTGRILRHHEWPSKLKGTELETVHPLFNPLVTQILAVEDGDLLVACWAFFPVPNAEGIWIHPGYRRRRETWRQLELLVNAVGAREGWPTIVTRADRPQIGRLIKAIGGLPLNFEHYVLPLPVQKIGQ